MQVPVKAIVAAATIGCATAAAPAALVNFDLEIEYSGGTPPAGIAPWLRAVFDDGGSPGSVTLSLDALNLSGSEFVNGWYFNLDPALNPANLQFTVVNRSGDFTTPVVQLGSDAFHAGGNTRFDIFVDFSNSPPGARFGPGDSISFAINGIASLTANSFDFLSVPGGKGPFPTAAKVQGVMPNDESGWITIIPEPASLGLMAVFATLLGRRRHAR